MKALTSIRIISIIYLLFYFIMYSTSHFIVYKIWGIALCTFSIFLIFIKNKVLDYFFGTLALAFLLFFYARAYYLIQSLGDKPIPSMPLETTVLNIICFLFGITIIIIARQKKLYKKVSRLPQFEDLNKM